MRRNSTSGITACTLQHREHTIKKKTSKNGLFINHIYGATNIALFYKLTKLLIGNLNKITKRELHNDHILLI